MPVKLGKGRVAVDDVDIAALMELAPHDTLAPTLAELASLARPGWQQRAACRGMGIDAFFPAKGRPARATLELCKSCSVRVDCLRWSIAQPAELDGLWAGVSKAGRAELRRRAVA